jgi:hypothetical protein
MSLDAMVYCDCYERGKIRRPPPRPEVVTVDESGEVVLTCNQPGTDERGFYDWLATACEHGPRGRLLSYRLGNIALVALLRSLLAREPNRFPILLTQVRYNGVHGGDFLSIEEVERLVPEVEHLKEVHADKEGHEPLVREFERQMRRLVQAALSVGKPIAF